MQYIVGAYSQLPYGSSAEEYETLLTKQLKPLLTMVYRNSSLKLLFRLSVSTFEYLELNHPEVNMLISDLCRKGQLEMLTSTYYDVVLSLIPNHERTSHIEKTTTYIRRHFSKKPRGLWVYNQVFNPAFVPVAGLLGLSYVVISSYNQVNGNIETTKPFHIDEMGRDTIIFPTDDRYSRSTSELYKGNVMLEKYLADITKFTRESSGSVSTIMLNMDQLMGIEGSSEVFRIIYDSVDGNSSLPGIYLQENEINNTHYLPCGIYGRDFQIGKATSINQLIYDSPMLSRNYGLVNMLRDVLRINKKNLDDRKNLDNLLMKASSSSLYFPNECRTPAVLRLINKNACEIEVLLSKLSNCPLPEETDLDFDRLNEFLVRGKSNILYLNGRGAVISRMIVNPCLHDVALNSGEGLFADSFINNQTGKEIRLSARPYEITPVDKKNGDFFAKAPQFILGKKSAGLNKSYKFRQSVLTVEIEIENLSYETIEGFTYENIINLSLPEKSDIICPEGILSDGESISTRSLTISDKTCPFSISIFTDSENTV
ncbi:MAG: hypothetical protein ACFN3H_06245, partial [Spirochaetales bacterium]